MDDYDECCCFIFPSCRSRNANNQFRRRRPSKTPPSSVTYPTNLCGGQACKLPDRRYSPRTYSNAAATTATATATLVVASNRCYNTTTSSLVSSSSSPPPPQLQPPPQSFCRTSRAQNKFRCEEIELKCYSLSPNCLLVNSDKRCQLVDMTNGLTRTRPLSDFEDGRKHLDVRRPDSMSLIKFRIDPESGQIERRMSTHNIDQDNEFVDLASSSSLSSSPSSSSSSSSTSSLLNVDDDKNCGGGQGSRSEDLAAAAAIHQSKRNALKVSERVLSRSFVLIERATPPTTGDFSSGGVTNDIETATTSNSGSSVAVYANKSSHCTGRSLIQSDQGQLSGASSEETKAKAARHWEQSRPTPFDDSSWDRIEEVTDETEPQMTNLEQELISSITIEAPQQQQQQQQQQNVERNYSNLPATKTKRKRSKSKTGLVRRFYKLISSVANGGGGGGAGPSRSSPDRDNYSTLDSTVQQSSSASAAYDNYLDTESNNNSNNHHPFCDRSYQRNNQIVPIIYGEPVRPQIVVRPVVEQNQQLVSLARPESIYLWPNKQQILSQTTTTTATKTTTNPNYNQQQQYSTSSSSPPSPVAMISYNHAEAKDYAIALHSQLEQLGVSTYLDLYDIGKGQDWQDSLNSAILNCSIFIPLITPSYGETLWTSRECKLADVLTKRIIPINFGQKWPPPSLAIQLATLQYIDWLQSDYTAALLTTGQQGNQSSSNTTTTTTAPTAWPSECVQTIACQLKKSIQSGLNGAAAAGAGASSSATAASAMRMIEPSPSPSPHSDSGYDELLSLPPPQPPLSLQKHAASKVAVVSPTLAASRAPASSKKSKGAAGLLSLKSVAPLNIGDTEPIVSRAKDGASLSGGVSSSSPVVFSYGSTAQTDSACGGELSPACSQSSSSSRSSSSSSGNEPVSPILTADLNSNGFKLVKTKTKTNTKAKTKLKQAHHEHRIDDDDGGGGALTCNTTGCDYKTCDCTAERAYQVDCNTTVLSSSETERAINLKKHDQHGQDGGTLLVKQMARKRSIGHHAKRVLGRVRRSLGSPKAY